MAIQMRRGNLANYDEDKMLPGEFAVATDEKELYIAFSTGDSKRVLTEDDAVPQTVQKIWTGSCTTSHNTAAKVIALDDSSGFSLVDGTVIAVYFKYGNDTTHPTLNVAGTGAKDIVYQTGPTTGAIVNEDVLYYRFGVGIKFFAYKSSVTLVGSDGYWVMMAPDFAAIKYLADYKAGLASPTFTGTPKAPTAAVGTNNTQIATTAFVRQSISKSKIWLGISNSTGDSATKYVSVTGADFEIVDGVLLLVTFSYINNVANITLKIGNTEIPVYINGSVDSAPRFFLKEPVLFIYQADYNRWAVVGGLDLRDTSRASYDGAVLNVSDRFYAVRQDASGYLSVCVPWTDTHTLTATDQGSGVVELSLT